MGATLITAFAVLWRHRARVGTLALAWAMLDFVLNWAWPLTGDAPGERLGLVIWQAFAGDLFDNETLPLFGRLGLSAVRVAVDAVLGIIVLAYLLAGTRVADGGLKFRRISTYVQLVSLGLALNAVYLVVLFLLDRANTLSPSSGHWLLVTFLGRFAAWAVPVWLAASLCFVLPNTALGRGLRLRESRHEARDAVTRLFVLFVLVLIPAAWIKTLVSALVFRFEMRETSLDDRLWAIGLSDSLLHAAAGLLLLAIVAVVFAGRDGRPGFARSGVLQTSQSIARAFE
ncbi:MAG: hypothetical protein HKM95_04065 [Inquilinus sp.]|nr:hypothetical protein [Inquilinus sp.]